MSSTKRWLHNRWVRMAALMLLTVTAALSITGQARAVEIISANFIGEDETIDDDLIISGERVVINGTILGDLLVTGDTVQINGTVAGSAMIFAFDTEITGDIGGSVYAFTGRAALSPEASIGRNLVTLATVVETFPGSTIGRGILASTNQANLNGTVERDVMAHAGAIRLTGYVGGDMNVEVHGPGDDPPDIFWLSNRGVEVLPPGLTFSPDAVIEGDLEILSTYDYTDEIPIQPGGELIQKAPMMGDTDNIQITVSPTAWFFSQARLLITLLILGWLGARLFPVFSEQARSSLMENPGRALGTGIVALFGGITAAGAVWFSILVLVILFAVVTLWGLANAFFWVGYATWGFGLTFFIMTILYGSRLVVSAGLGRLVFHRFFPEYEQHERWPVITGIAIFVVAQAIPVLGAFINLAAVLLGLGGIWIALKKRRRHFHHAYAPETISAPPADDHIVENNGSDDTENPEGN